MGCGLGSSSITDKKDGKGNGPSLGLASKWMGPSFAEVLRSDSVLAAKVLSTVGGRQPRIRVMLVKPCALDLLPAERSVEEAPRSAVDCYSLEIPLLVMLDKD